MGLPGAAVILACGGLGRLFPVTTNAAGMTGDGYALAHLAGARLQDMEFIQFHLLAGEAAGRETAKATVNHTTVDPQVTAEACRYLPAGGEPPAALRRELQQTVAAGLSLVRNRNGLDRTLAAIESLAGRLAGCRVDDHAGLLAYHQTRLMVTCAALVARAALARPASLGAHFRSD